MRTRGGVANLRILAPVIVLAAVPRAAFAQASLDTGPAMGPLGWLFVFFALAGAALAIILLRRLQAMRAALVQIEAERDRLSAREAALSLGRIRWRGDGGLEVEDNAARLLSARPDTTEKLLALMAEPGRAEIASGLAAL